MRSFLSCLFLVFTTHLLAQSGVQFTSPIPVSGGSTFSYAKPKIVLDANNEPVVLWGKISTGQVFVSTYNGSGFNVPVQVNPPGTQVYISGFYNADIKSHGDTIVVVFATDVPAYRTYLVKSVDGGDTWGDTVRVDQLIAGQIAYFPSVDINESGKVAVTYMRHDAGWQNPRYVVSTSYDGGSSFLPDTNASAVAAGEVCDCCPAEMIYEGNTQVLVFRNNDSNTREFYASISNDNGNSYSGINIDNLSWIFPACPSVAPSGLINNDSLIVAFMNGVSGNNRIYISTNSISGMANGNIWPVDTVVPSGTIQTHPQLAGEDSIMAMVWNNNMPGSSEIYFRFSNSGAAGLQGDGMDLTNASGTQQYPDIAYSNGVFHIVYQNNPTQEVYYLKAILDEYIGIEEPESLNYHLKQNNSNFTLYLSGSNTMNNSYSVFDILGRNIFSGEIVNNLLEFDMKLNSHGLYWIYLKEKNSIVKFYW